MEQRNSNIELLRILCMITIILHHSFCYSNLPVDFTNINYTVFYTVQFLGRISNNIFIIITGYYMANKDIKFKSIIKLIIEVIFYSYLILIIFFLLVRKIEINMLLKSIFPISTGAQWFVTSYLLLYILIPFLNILIKNMNKQQFRILLGILVFCFCVLPIIKLIDFSYYNFFILLYFLGAYLRINKEDFLYKNNNMILLISLIAYIVLVLLVTTLKIKVINLYESNNIIFLILSISIFVSFIKKKQWYNNTVNYIASSVLGIYLIHDNIIVRNYIWKKLNIPNVIDNNYFALYLILVILFIFCSCLLVDKIRIRIIEKPLDKYFDSKTRNKQVEKEKKCHV